MPPAPQLRLRRRQPRTQVFPALGCRAKRPRRLGLLEVSAYDSRPSDHVGRQKPTVPQQPHNSILWGTHSLCASPDIHWILSVKRNLGENLELPPTSRTDGRIGLDCRATIPTEIRSNTGCGNG